MLGQLDLTRSIGKDEYRQRLPELQAQLYAIEQALLETSIPVVIAFEGWAGTSKIGTIGVLMRRLDPRGLRVHSITAPRTYETQYPWLHRFWLQTPSYGQIAIFDRSWYREVLAARTRKQVDDVAWRERCEDIAAFERQLAADGAVIVKFWLHIARKEQRQRFDKLEADPLTAWQVTSEDRWQQRHYRRVRSAVEDLVARTDAPYAPWIALPATDRRYAEVTMLETVIGALGQKLGITPEAADEVSDEGVDERGAALRQRLNVLRGVGLPPTPPGAQPGGAEDNAAPASAAAPEPVHVTTPGILSRLDLTQQANHQEAEREQDRLQAKLHLLGYQVYRQKRPVILVFEG